MEIGKLSSIKNTAIPQLLIYFSWYFVKGSTSPGCIMQSCHSEPAAAVVHGKRVCLLFLVMARPVQSWRKISLINYSQVHTRRAAYVYVLQNRDARTGSVVLYYLASPGRAVLIFIIKSDKIALTFNKRNNKRLVFTRTHSDGGERSLAKPVYISVTGQRNAH